MESLSTFILLNGKRIAVECRLCAVFNHVRQPQVARKNPPDISGRCRISDGFLTQDGHQGFALVEEKP
jgi:hypothetical protein